MGLKLEKTGHFVKSKSEVWTFLFFNISAIIGIVCLLSFGGTFGLEIDPAPTHMTAGV